MNRTLRKTIAVLTDPNHPNGDTMGVPPVIIIGESHHPSSHTIRRRVSPTVSCRMSKSAMTTTMSTIMEVNQSEEMDMAGRRMSTLSKKSLAPDPLLKVVDPDPSHRATVVYLNRRDSVHPQSGPARQPTVSRSAMFPWRNLCKNIPVVSRRLPLLRLFHTLVGAIPTTRPAVTTKQPNS